MNKEELLKEIETQKLVVEALKEKLLNKEQQLKSKILDAFSDIIDVDKHIRLDFNNDIYIEIELLNAEQKRIFGTTVDIYCRERYNEKATIELNTGTCGSFTIEDVAQIKKYEIVTNFWKNYDKYSKALLEAKEEIKPYEKEFWDAANELNRLKRELENLERKEEAEKILSTINVKDNYTIKGGWSIKRWFKGNDSLIVTKITDNSVLVEYHCNGFVTTETGRIKKDDFIYYIKDNYLVKENN